MVVRKLKQYFTKIYSTQLKIVDNAISFSSIILPHISVFYDMLSFFFLLDDDDAIGIYICTYPTLLDDIYRISYY